MNEAVYQKYGLSPIIDREVDTDELDVEWFEHTNAFGEYSDAYAEAAQKRDSARLKVERAKENVERIKAELNLVIRQSPEEYDLVGKDGKKPTEATIESCIKTQDPYIQAMEQYFAAWENQNECKYEAEVLSGAVKTMEQKKSSLENAIRLMNMQYFETSSEPKTNPKVRHDAKKKRRKAVQQKIQEAMDDEDVPVTSKKRKRKRSSP